MNNPIKKKTATGINSSQRRNPNANWRTLRGVAIPKAGEEMEQQKPVGGQKIRKLLQPLWL